MSKFILEIPSQFPVTAWSIESDKDIIKMAKKTKDFTYEFIKKEEAFERRERDQMEKEVIEKLEAGEEVVYWGWGWQAWLETVDNAPAEIEAAKEALFHDLNSYLILNEEEMKRLARGDHKIYNGHKFFEAVTASKKILEEEGLF